MMPTPTSEDLRRNKRRQVMLHRLTDSREIASASSFAMVGVVEFVMG
jgi:hypothetical protein